MKLKQHVFLTGFMGSGKSTAGKALAALLKTRCIDLDDYLEKKEGRSIPEIFETEGEESFRKKEQGYLEELLKLKDPHIISLGGGTICFFENLKRVKAAGILLYIELPIDILAQRIQESKFTRPLLKELSTEDLIKNISEILTERKKFYEQAHITVNGLILTPNYLKQKISAYSETTSA